MVRSLWDALGEVPDRRGRQGRHYELRSILGIAIAAMLAGANDLRAIFRWGRRLRPQALRLFGIDSGRAPCHATYHYFFQALDGDALSTTLGRLALGEAVAGHIAIDGKTLRGSRRHDGDGLPPDVGFAETVEKGHGRIETRRIAVSEEVVAYLAWPGLAQVARVERRRWIGARKASRSPISSLPCAILPSPSSAVPASPSRKPERTSARIVPRQSPSSQAPFFE